MTTLGAPPTRTADAHPQAPAPAVAVTSAREGHDLVLTTAAPADRPAWTVLAATLALADALRSAAGVPAEVVWPDGVTLPRTMCGGAGTVQRVADACLDAAREGAGPTTAPRLTLRLTLTGSALDLPPGRTSVWSEGGRTDEAAITAAYRSELSTRLAQLATGDARLPADYRARCVTIGRMLDLPDGTQAWVSAVAPDGTPRARRGTEDLPLPPETLQELTR